MTENRTPSTLPDSHPEPVPHAPSAATSARARWRAAGARLVYWTPVLVPMVLFAQVAFLGLRPALCEKRRLAAAEVELRARYERDERLASDVAAHWRARHDPVFVERQRRLRELPPGASSVGSAPTDSRAASAPTPP